ncbi:similar to Saccharomyces cerevisiae YPR037C ERV2 Flavin-linked sulfhydryl oxidase localized to the endoplasmic reticulum lumen, involved in disulfide bond formation within the ER [Maudiozyma saulgeensis]|uniref:Sulfhydryl oxidase n=1 Tax=Maudiozyma saulgeensis TaxID=1789683 RepID=A0A1X7QYY6_9SACH|nr:similar to Saccharomyces cerevisiae YPR037C ERV2 Flavin-linked sulfhydryl oxidase localized to the endoplasmic reticulum lumen, involved in disulfide bond formation within the ER [Kazachstania saulgeensis]
MSLWDKYNVKKDYIYRTIALLFLIITWILLSSGELDGSIPHSKIFFKSLNLDNYFTSLNNGDKVSQFTDVQTIINKDSNYMKFGRATWKTFHVMMEMFPDVNMNNNDDLKKRDKLVDWINLIGETYPCSKDSNNIFLQSVQRYPLPINLNKIINIEWGCHIHNLVNERLEKVKYNCSQLILDLKQTEQDYNQDIEYNDLDKVTLNKEDKQLG